MEDFVQIIDVVKRFDATLAVAHINLSIRKGEIFALLGSSGCGKSTLLRILAGFEIMTSGRITLDGQDIAQIPPYRRPVNMMFQSYALFPHMTVEENVEFGLKQEGMRQRLRRERVAQVLDLVQMGRYAKRRPHQLSGGQQQRTALARSLVKRPKLLLLDEPMSALDKQIRQRTQIELMDILDKVGVACMLVTHDQEEAMIIADRMAVMSEGRILQIGTPQEIYEYPNSRFCAEFIGSTNLFSGRIVQHLSDQILVESAELGRCLSIKHGGADQLGKEVSISVRPERITVTRQAPPIQSQSPHNLQSPMNWARGKIDNIVYMGGYTIYHIVLESGRIVMANVLSAVFSNTSPPSYDDPVFITWSPESARVLVS